MDGEGGSSGKQRASIVGGPLDLKTETVPSRIGTSASKLLKSTLLQPNGVEVSSTLASSSSGSSKGESSSSNQYRAASQEGSTELNAHIASQSLSQGDGILSGKKRFRSQPAHAAQIDFDAFAQQDSSTAISATLHQEFLGTYISEYSSSFENAQRAQIQSPRTPSESQEYISRDGEEVINLLANPDFVLEYAPPTADDIESEGHFEDLFDVPSNSSTGFKEPDSAVPANPLSFIPRFELPEGPCVEGEKSAAVTTLTEKLNLSTLKYCGGYEELDPWIDILTRYHDDVWGSHLPLVQKAREEIKDAMDGNKTKVNDFPALRRLAMVLGHFEGHKNV